MVRCTHWFDLPVDLTNRLLWTRLGNQLQRHPVSLAVSWARHSCVYYNGIGVWCCSTACLNEKWQVFFMGVGGILHNMTCFVLTGNVWCPDDNMIIIFCVYTVTPSFFFQTSKQW